MGILMSCTEYTLKIGPYVDGELDREGRDDVENHLDQCSACRQTAHGFRTLDRLSENIVPAAVSGDEWKQTLETIRRRTRDRQAADRWTSRPSRWLAPVLSLAALLLLGFFSATVFESSAPQNPQTLTDSQPTGSRPSTPGSEGTAEIPVIDDADNSTAEKVAEKAGESGADSELPERDPTRRAGTSPSDL